MTALLVDVTDLLERTGARAALVFDESLDGLRNDLAHVDADDPMHFDLVVESLDEGILVRGGISGSYVAACRRCLDESRRDFGVDVTELYRPPSDVWEEGYVIDGRTVDLRTMVRDNVSLALPEFPLCRAECKGMCTRCGANLNERTCGCPQEVSDDRWAALRSLAGPPTRRPNGR